MTSLKKLTAVLAVSLPLLAVAQTPPAAPAPLYQIYGTLNVNFHVEEAFGATNPAASVHLRQGISTDSTNIGIRGTASVSNGLGVVYQCESSADVSATAVAGICGRNSRLGLSSAFGTLFYGNWDTPYKAAWYGTKADDAMGNTDVFDAAALLSSPGLNTKATAGQTAAAPAAGTAGLTFAVRAADSVAYHSPKFMGLSAKVQYSGNRFADVNVVRNPELYSAVVNYDGGPISVLAAYEQHEDWNSVSSSDMGWKVGAGYELGTAFGTTTLGAVFEELKFKDKTVTTAALKEYTRDAVMVNLKHRTGNHEFRARWSYADNGDCKTGDGSPCNFDIGRGAKNYALGYAYYLAASTQVYAFWTQIDNERGAQYTFATAGFNPPTGATPAGADPWAAGLGMKYAF